MDVEETAFEKVAMNVDVPGAQQPQTIGKGRLSLTGGGLDFQSDKGQLSMRPVRSVESTGKGVKVEFGEGRELRTVYLIDMSQGVFKARSANKVMAEALRQSLQLKGLTEAEAADRDKGDRVVAQAVMKKAKVQMWVWGLIAVAGTIATLATMSAASDGGGTYYVFWGAVVFGIGGVLEAYFDRYRKYRKVLERAGTSGPGAGAAA